MNILSLLTILFIGLKLTDNIDWNWFWVLSPTVIPLMTATVMFAAAGFLIARSEGR